MEPLYTTENTSAAYQLNWSVALFGVRELPSPSEWRGPLELATESDGVRLLECHTLGENVVQFLVSTTPTSTPAQIVRSIKERLQYLIRAKIPKAFRRNYYIGSVGEANSSVLDQYVGRQTENHLMADPGVQQRFEDLQFHDPEIDLGLKRTGTYGQFVHSLQIVLENTEAWHEVRQNVLKGSQQMILRCAAKKKWLISRIGLLSNHIHVLVGASVTESPSSIALPLLNNLAYVQGMKPVFRFSYYAGTFGEYDRGAIRSAVDA